MPTSGILLLVTRRDSADFDEAAIVVLAVVVGTVAVVVVVVAVAVVVVAVAVVVVAVAVVVLFASVVVLFASVVELVVVGTVVVVVVVGTVVVGTVVVGAVVLFAALVVVVGAGLLLPVRLFCWGPLEFDARILRARSSFVGMSLRTSRCLFSISSGTN